MKTVWAFIHFIIIFIILFDFVKNKKLQKSFEEIFGDGWHLKEEANLAQIMAKENDQQQKRSGEGQSNDPMISETDQNEEKENDESDQQQKRGSIRKFHAIKEKIKQRKGKQSHKEWNKIERTITKKLGTNRKYIYKWIRELGMGQRRINEAKWSLMMKYWEIKRKDPKMSGRKIAKALQINEASIRRWKTQFEGETIFKELEMDMKKQLIVDDERKRTIVREFRAIKEQIRQKGRKYSHKQWDKIEKLLAKKLGTNRDYVYRWINEFGMNIKKHLFFSNEQKRKIVRAFRAIKKKIKQKWKLTKKEWNKIEICLAQKLVTNRRYIYMWIKEFGMGKKTVLTNERKMAIVKQYWEMKRNNPKMSDTKIAKALKVSRDSIRKWKVNK